MRQIAADVLACGSGDEVGVGAAPGTKDAVLLTIPVLAIGGVVVGLVHVLVDAEVQLDRRSTGTLCNLDHRLGLGAGQDAQPLKGLDPVLAAGLTDIGLAAAFRLHGDLARPQQPGRDAGAVQVVAAVDFEAQRVALEQLRAAAGVQDQLREGDRSVAAESDAKGRILAGVVAAQRVGQFNAEDAGKNVSHCKTSRWVRVDAGAILNRLEPIAVWRLENGHPLCEPLHSRLKK